MAGYWGASSPPQAGWETSGSLPWPRVGASGEEVQALSTGAQVPELVSGEVRGKYLARLGARQTW